jgi:toxin FitB
VPQIVYIPDTNILSLAGLPEPPERLIEWMKRIGIGRLALCHPVICELLRGAHMAATSNPGKSERLLAWVYRLRHAGFIEIATSWEVSDAYARLVAERRLKFLWAGDPRRKNNKLGHDLVIAANSIAHGMPIATTNVGDFLAIHECIPLPGLYDPLNDKWHVEPGTGNPLAGTLDANTLTWLIPTI